MSIWPSCISTSVRAKVRPMPSPPVDRSSAGSAWRNMSNTRGNMSAAMPTPVSRIRRIATSDCRSAVNQMWPSRGVNFTALFSTFANTCTSRAPSPSTEMAGCGGCMSSVCPAAVASGAIDSTAVRHQLSQIVRFTTQLDLVGGDARHVEQIVDEAHQLSDLAFDDVTCVCRRGQRRAALERLEREADRGERIAELVGERRQELVLALIRFEQFGGPVSDAKLQLAVERVAMVLGLPQALDQVLVREAQPERGLDREMEAPGCEDRGDREHRHRETP